jgi:hypothetical protein
MKKDKKEIVILIVFIAISIVIGISMSALAIKNSKVEPNNIGYQFPYYMPLR